MPSLELGVTPVAVGNDAVVGYTRVYGSHISWSTPTTPLARELNPRAVYERLFRAAQGSSASEAGLDSLLLDRVLQDAKRLRKRLGSSDRARLDEYLASVRSLEERVQWSTRTERSNWEPLTSLDLRDAPTERPFQPLGARALDARHDRRGVPVGHDPRGDVHVRQRREQHQLPLPRRRHVRPP